MMLRKLAISAAMIAGISLTTAPQANMRFALGYPSGSIPAVSAQVWADTL